MAGWKDWQPGEVVNEDDFQSFIQNQVIQFYDTETQRDNTLGTNVAEGMFAYTNNNGELRYYRQGNWLIVGEIGDITSVIAGTALTGGGTSGSVTLDVDLDAVGSAVTIDPNQVNGTAVITTDSRLSDARTPTAHATSHESGGSDEIEIEPAQVTGTAVIDSDSRLTDARTPTSHASTHESGGSDEIEIAQSQVTGLDSGTAGFTALSNGTAGLSYQPVSHNYIINGAFDIWQRGTSGTANSDYVSADRWKTVSIASISQLTDTPNSSFKYSAQIVGGNLDNFKGAATLLEADQTYLLAGQNVTVSFWIKADQNALDNNGFFSFVYADTTENDFSSVTNVGSGKFFQNEGVVANTWTNLSFTFSMPSAANKGLRLAFFPNGNQTATVGTINITGVQLEAGSIATPFKRNANSIQGEELACLRYYQRISSDSLFGYFANGVAPNSSLVRYIQFFRAPLRSSPSLAISGSYQAVGASPLNVISFSGASAKTNLSILIDANVSGATAGGGYHLRANNDLNAFIELSAEL